MKLKHTKEVKIIVDESDFNDLVEEIYSQPYEFVADVEGNNNSSYEYDVKKGEFDTEIGRKFYRRDIEIFKKDGKYSFLAGHLLNDLADKDIIEEGNYLINVSW